MVLKIVQSDRTSDYDLYYKQKDISSDTQKIVSDCHLHDAVRNFSFTKYLFNRGLISCDAIVSSILNMSSEEYAKHLDQVFNL